MCSAQFRSISALIAILLCYTAANGFASTRIGDITITPGVSPSGSSDHGYAEYRISVLNHSPDKMHVVTLKLPDTSHNIDLNRIRDITRSVVVGPGSTAHVSLFQPPVPLHGNDVAVVIDGRLQREAVPLSLGNHAPDMSHSFASHFVLGAMGSISLPLSLQVLVSRNIDTSEFHAHVGKLVKSIPTMSGFSVLTSTSGSVVTSSGSSSSTGSASYELIDLGFPVSAWSTDWLGFSRYDGIVVTNEDIQQMPSDVQAALWEYVECGGALLVLGGNNLPDNWASGVEISNKSAGMSANRVGFGEFFISAETDTTSLNQTQWRQIVHSWVKTATPWQSQLSIAEANNRFPVVDDFGVPVRGLFLLMLVFAIVIGPMNLIVLSRKRRRVWMLWTVPVISLTTCFAVFLYATFAEGWDRYIRTEGLTILDQRVNRATSIGVTAFYSALTPGDGLHFGYETELTSQTFATTPVPRTVNWTHDQHLARGWIAARVPAHFKVRKTEMRRERITVRRGEGSRLGIVNGLGADIDQFWLADKEGTVYDGSNIRAGSEAELTIQNDLQLHSLSGIGEMFVLTLWDPAVNAELDKGNLSPILRDEMIAHGTILSDDVAVSVLNPGSEWQLTDRVSELSYTINTNSPMDGLKIHSEIGGLRGIFASENWIEKIERLKSTPEKFLSPGCYIATLNTSPFIENGLRNTTKRNFSSIVYGILNED